ncbi:putative oxidoreductase alpha (Molybdopterin) subunit [Burkholderia mallei]|nr:putative oxidoreductase alpha (Molybdopterin) subunit [Burkholderia mallei]SUX14272.1 putative oxidoreductase alpha (Molybdopterin) subunit [Burkholderia mallei]
MTCRFEDIFEISAEKRERRYETGDRMRGRRGGASCCGRRAGRAAGSPRAGAKHARAFQFVSPPHASAQRAARSSRAPARIGSRPAGVVAAGIHSMSRRHGARAPVMGAGAPAIHGIAAKTVAGIGREPRPPGASSAHADRAAGLRDARAGRHRRCRRSRVRALAWCVMRDAGSMFEPRRCARHSFRYALAPGCRLHRRSRVQAVRQRDDLTDTDIERSGKARRRMNRARDSPARRERRIFHARAKMSARLDHSGERRQSRQARGAPSGSIGERRRPDIVDESLRADRGGPRRPVRDAPAGEERSMRSVTILSCRTAADSCCAAAYYRWTDGQMARAAQHHIAKQLLAETEKAGETRITRECKTFRCTIKGLFKSRRTRTLRVRAAV